MATAPPTNADDAAPKKGKKKLIIIIAAAVAVLGLGGGGTLFYLKKKAAAEEEVEAEVDDKPSKTAKRDGKTKPTFVALDMFTVNLADRDADRYAQIQLSLELTDEKSAELIKNFTPVIRNNILMVLSHKTSAELLEKDGKIKLARDLRREIAKALGLEPLEEDLPKPPKKPKAETEAGAEEEEAPRKRRRPKPEEMTPVIGVHFSNFIIQ